MSSWSPSTRQLLSDLLSARVLVRDGDWLSFKYKFFYAYFLGRFAAGERKTLELLTASDVVVTLDGLVEVLTAVTSSSTEITKHITSEARSSIKDVWEKYPALQIDPFEGVAWSYSDEEQDRLWQPVLAELAEGPAKIAEIDEATRSYLTELRAEDQAIVISTLDELERRAVVYGSALSAALVSGELISGQVKKDALRALLDNMKLTYSVGLMHAPLIAKSLMFYWNGIIFKNNFKFTEEHDEVRRALHIALAMSDAVAKTSVSVCGSKKLGEVIAALYREGNVSLLDSLLLFALIIRTKPNGWFDLASSIINGTSRTSYYLYWMLIAARREFQNEANTGGDQERLKRLVAHLKVKRDLRKDRPGEKAITHGVNSLDDTGFLKS